MNNLIIAAITLVMLPALEKESFAKNNKNYNHQQAMLKVERLDVSNLKFKNEDESNLEERTEVNVDYMINENGKAFITYVNSESNKAKEEVVKFIEILLTIM